MTSDLPELAPFALPPGAVAGLIVFAEYSNSDICLFDPAQAEGPEYPIIDGYHEWPDQWRTAVIAPNFEEWLRRMLESLIEKRQYLEYWIPTPLSPS